MYDEMFSIVDNFFKKEEDNSNIGDTQAVTDIQDKS